MTILIVEDEPSLRDMTARYLNKSGFDVRTAGDGNEALRVFTETGADLVVMDIMMPGIDGLESARRMWELRKVPLIFLSAKSEEADRILGLEWGADDYLTKPFSPRELLARIKAVLRRGQSLNEDLATSGGTSSEPRGLSINEESRRVSVDGRDVPLTAVQFDILRRLWHSPGRVFSRTEITRDIAGTVFEGYQRTVDVHIKNLRKALSDSAGEPRFIETVRGVGYRFLEQDRYR